VRGQLGTHRHTGARGPRASSRALRHATSTRGLCLTQGLRRVTLVPRTCAVLPGIRSLVMVAACLAPLNGATWADAGRGAAPLAWAKRAPPSGWGVQRGTGRAGETALFCGAFVSTVAAVSPGLCDSPSEGSQGRGRPHQACPSPVVCLPHRRWGRHRRVRGPRPGQPRTLSPSYAPCVAGTSSEDNPPPTEAG